jgi:hypothetical protein
VFLKNLKHRLKIKERSLKKFKSCILCPHLDLFTNIPFQTDLSSCRPFVRSRWRSILSPLTWHSPSSRGMASPCLASEYSCDYYGILVYRTGGKPGREPRHLRSPQRSIFSRCLSEAAHTFSASGLDIGCGGEIVCLCLLP